MPAKFNRRGEEGSWSPDERDDMYRDKLRSLLKVTETGCWEYQGWCNEWGYGTMGYRGKTWMVPRLAHVLWKGPIPKGFYICHTCDNPPCANPDHLWAGKSRENLKDCVAKGRHTQANQTHCKHGHPLSGDNVRTYKHGDGKLKRHCQTCVRIGHEKQSYIEWRRAYQAKRRAAKRAQHVRTTTEPM